LEVLFRLLITAPEDLDEAAELPELLVELVVAELLMLVES
jgi:hypothetical protein